jgi:hypothetical protein
MNALKPEFHLNNIRIAVVAAQETHYVSITNTNRLTLFREMYKITLKVIRDTQINCVWKTQSF